MSDSISCPDPTCAASAQIIDRWTWESTVGPDEHVKTMCGRGHGFTPPLDLLATEPTAPPLVALAARA